MLSITRIFKFEAAHAISNHSGACRNIHGHSYHLEITIVPKAGLVNNMVMDFKELKGIVEKSILNDYDHALILKNGIWDKAIIDSISPKTIWLQEEPTAEIIITDMVARITPLLPAHVYLKKLLLKETAKCYAAWENNAI
ncbi:MAG: 6-carboxytetrahydropterin synthase [Bacteroidia bacterium]|nr:6-carboxytetrahydropterin synthase [Bacteroidia bacterium]MCZ2139998.1 6-carboxytetrahydropterin synthase [Bacteroidia bacterium]